MFKFFRKIRQQLLHQSKFPQYLVYAIGETLLVVLGILIALQINKWNQHRLDRNTETQLIMELKEDFTINQERLDRGLNAQGRIVQNTTEIRAIISEPIPDTVDVSLLLMPLYNMRVFTFDPVAGTIQDVLTSDKLSLFQNEKLRRKLADWSGIIADTKEEEEKVLHFKQNDLRPFMLDCCPLSNRFDWKPNEFLKDHRLDNLLSTYLMYLNQQTLDYGPLIDYLDEVLGLLEEELEK